MPCALHLTWQRAVAFNQPLLSFNTSSVTDMEKIFHVRFTRAKPPPSLQLLPA